MIKNEEQINQRNNSERENNEQIDRRTKQKEQEMKSISNKHQKIISRIAINKAKEEIDEPENKEKKDN